MKITCNNFSYQKINPQFKSYSAVYKTPNGGEMGTFTWFFREDLNWKEFSNYQIEQFKHKDKVNLVQFGASDGTEAFTQIISLMENPAKENVEKFFPIISYDINEGMVQLANSGYINIEAADKTKLGQNALVWRKYFKNIPEDKLNRTYKVEPILYENVKFNQGDMFELLPKIKDYSNTVLLCRNCLGYFSEKEIREFIQTASDVLKRKSMIAIGHLEEDEIYMEDLLRKNGFIKVMRNVFQKI